jgi:uncharacterized protein YndB with AHSA1/START domain
LNNLTKIKINKPANEVYEAFVDPSKIGNFWFSSSSERWEEGKTVTLRYEEYGAQGDINITSIMENEFIEFRWGPKGEENTVTIKFIEEDKATIVEIKEDGFNESDGDFIWKILDNKEGWVYVLTCLKGYLEFGATTLRASLLKG